MTMPTMQEIMTKGKAWIATMLVVVFSTAGAVFWALEYFETKSNSAKMACLFQIQDRIIELSLDMMSDELLEYRLSNEKWVLEQEEQTFNIQSIIEIKDEQRQAVLRRMIQNRNALIDEESRKLTDCN